MQQIFQEMFVLYYTTKSETSMIYTESMVWYPTG